jgi:protein-tyrosine phosphatase
MKIVFVCLGNICRSPLAEGILRQKALNENLLVEIDSAGTSGLHAGSPPDSRMRATAKKYGVDIDALRSRQLTKKDMQHFDWIYVMDSENYKNVCALASNSAEKGKIKLLLDEPYPMQNRSVPDPYYGGEQGFTEVYTLLDTATDYIIDNIKQAISAKK